MKKNAAYYVISVDDELMSAPIAKADRKYLLDVIVPNLSPLSEGDYKAGPVILRASVAPNSTILLNNDVYLCFEYDPGLIVIRSSPNGELAWAALRSPIPNFGGREATEEEMLAFDEDAENHQYNLIFTPWDAQFDEDSLEDAEFDAADEDLVEVLEAAMAPINRLGTELTDQLGDQASVTSWYERGQAMLQSMAGDGIRPQ